MVVSAAIGGGQLGVADDDLWPVAGNVSEAHQAAGVGASAVMCRSSADALSVPIVLPAALIP